MLRVKFHFLPLLLLLSSITHTFILNHPLTNNFTNKCYSLPAVGVCSRLFFICFLLCKNPIGYPSNISICTWLKSSERNSSYMFLWLTHDTFVQIHKLQQTVVLYKKLAQVQRNSQSHSLFLFSKYLLKACRFLETVVYVQG